MRGTGGAVSGPGHRLSRRLRSAGAFWYDFIVGDDWRGAAAVAMTLAVTALLAHIANVNAWWLMPVGVFAALGWSLRRAVIHDRVRSCALSAENRPRS